MKVYSVWDSGPSIGGRIALFDSKIDAEKFCDDKTLKAKFSETSVKDKNGISKAWLMGDGQTFIQEEELPLDEYFEWS